MTVRRSAAIPYTILRGAVTGSLPTALCGAEMFQPVVIALFAGVVLSPAGVALPRWRRASRWGVWIAVPLGVVSLVLNLVTPSSGERLVWAPIVFLLLVSGVVVAAGKPARKGSIAAT